MWWSWAAPRVIVGIHVAGPGKDETTICVRAGKDASRTRSGTSATPSELRVRLSRSLRPSRVVFNASTSTSRHRYHLRVAFREEGYVIQSVNFGAGPANKDKSWEVQCANRKAEMYWRTREVLNAGLIHGLDDEMISQAAQGQIL